jgi:dihydroorotase
MWKMNPPLRAREDRNALIAGVLDGTIDIIATDHAPHTMEEKIRGIEKSSFGIVGSETAFAQLYTKFVKTDIFSLEMLVKLMSENVAKIFNLPYGKLEENSFADIVVIDLEKEITINPEEFLSKGRNTPYANEKVNGIPVLTISNGKIAYIDKEEINL